MLNINGEEWSILLVSPFHPGLQRTDGSFALGVCDDSSKTIYINDSVDSELIKKILCHELTHAAMFSYNVYLDIAQEELIADLMATYGQEIVCNTNKIFKRIQEKWRTY